MNTDYPVIQNQGWTKEIGNSYARLPQRAKSEVREPLWNLSRNSAGLAIHFYSNANNITIRYKVEDDTPILIEYQDVAAKAFYFGIAAGLFSLIGLYLRKLRG